MTIQELVNIGLEKYDLVLYKNILENTLCSYMCTGNEYIREHYLNDKCCFTITLRKEEIPLDNITMIKRLSGANYVECYPNNKIEDPNHVII